MAVEPLVQTQWLRQQMLDGAKNLCILDGSWHVPAEKRNAKEEHEQKRIPGAVFFDIQECMNKSSPYPYMIPSAEEFCRYMEKLGIANDTHIVVYDRNEKFGLFSAPRVWWTFRVFGHNLVSVLDGGLPKWCSDGFPTESGPLKELPKAGKLFLATYNKDLIVDYEFILGNVSSPDRITVLDTRPEFMYKDGHIPFAKSFFFAKCIDNEKKVMKTPEEMQKVFEEHGVDLSQPLVATCALAISGAFVLFGSYLAGKTDTRLYDGAWAEFGQRAPKEMIEK